MDKNRTELFIALGGTGKRVQTGREITPRAGEESELIIDIGSTDNEKQKTEDE